jgi:hypothetical protein
VVLSYRNLLQKIHGFSLKKNKSKVRKHHAIIFLAFRPHPTTQGDEKSANLPLSSRKCYICTGLGKEVLHRHLASASIILTINPTSKYRTIWAMVPIFGR